MKLLVQFPTLGRPEKFIDVLKKYVDKTSGEQEILFNINCDANDKTMHSDYSPEVVDRIYKLFKSKPHCSCVINFDKDTTKISAMNSHMDDKDFDIVICPSDDMIPREQHWDVEITNAMQEHFPDLDGCVHFDDGNTNGKLITFSILGKKLYDHFGYIYHPDYKSLYADDEFTQEVRALDKEKYIDKVLITHDHWSLEGTENSGDIDFAVQKTLYYAGRDEAVFKKRKELGFPKDRITND